MRTGRNESEIVLWSDREWSQIDGEPCRVSALSTLGSFREANGKVHTTSRTMPYASLTLECGKLGKNIRGYVTHKMDFQHLWAALKERRVNEAEEVIIIWTREEYRYKLTKFLSRFMPKLRVMVCPKGAYELMTDSKYKPELWGEARWNAMRPVSQWKPEVMR